MHRGDLELEDGHFDEACRSFLAATDYYWLALNGSCLREAERRAVKEAQISAFRSAVPLLPHLTTPFELVVEGVRVTGYLFLPAGSRGPCPAVIWPVEPDATVESSYRQIAVAILESGVACAVCAPANERRSHRDDDTPWVSMAVLTDAVTQWVQQQPGVDATAEPLRLPPNGQGACTPLATGVPMAAHVTS